MRLFKSLVYYVRQIQGYLIFGKRVYVHGRFRVGDKRNIVIGDRCSINEGAYLLGRCRIVIGNRVTLSARSMLLDSGLDISSDQRRHTDGFIVIEDDVWVGAGAIILSGVTIGRGSVVGSGSVVTRDVEAGVVVAGNPARIIRRLAASAHSC